MHARLSFLQHVLVIQTFSWEIAVPLRFTSARRITGTVTETQTVRMVWYAGRITVRENLASAPMMIAAIDVRSAKALILFNLTV